MSYLPNSDSEDAALWRVQKELKTTESKIRSLKVESARIANTLIRIGMNLIERPEAVVFAGDGYEINEAFPAEPSVSIEDVDGKRIRALTSELRTTLKIKDALDKSLAS